MALPTNSRRTLGALKGSTAHAAGYWWGRLKPPRSASLLEMLARLLPHGMQIDSNSCFPRGRYCQGGSLPREAQSRDISGPKKSKYLPQKFYLLTIREGSLTSYLLQENLEIVAVLLFIIPVANQVSSPGVELCRG